MFGIFILPILVQVIGLSIVLYLVSKKLLKGIGVIFLLGSFFVSGILVSLIISFFNDIFQYNNIYIDGILNIILFIIIFRFFISNFLKNNKDFLKLLFIIFVTNIILVFIGEKIQFIF